MARFNCLEDTADNSNKSFCLAYLFIFVCFAVCLFVVNGHGINALFTWSAGVPEKKPKRTVAAAAPAAPADDTPLLSLKIYSRCGTSAGTHTAATRDGRGCEWSLRKE